MYLLNVKSIVSAEKLGTVREAHSEWVKKGFEKKWFVFAGPKVGELGGLILVKPMSRKELDQFIAIDPYIIEKVAVYEISEFEIKVTADGLEQLKG
jgi:uncharacterized protein YciI